MKNLKNIPGYIILLGFAAAILVGVLAVRTMFFKVHENVQESSPKAAEILEGDKAYKDKLAKVNEDAAQQLRKELTGPLQPKDDYCEAWRREVIAMEIVGPEPSEQMVLEAKAKAESGDVAAETNVGEAYLRGEGVVKDYQQAKAWLQKAADQGSRRAAAMLGDAFSLNGRDQDWGEAYFWYSVASVQGTSWSGGWLVHRDCRAARQHLTQEQISELNTVVLKWLKDKKLLPSK